MVIVFGSLTHTHTHKHTRIRRGNENGKTYAKSATYVKPSSTTHPLTAGYLTADLLH